MSDMRTPLSHVRGHGSARTGTTHFWMQRLTAFINLPLALFFVALLLALIGADYQTVRSYLAHPLVAIPLLGLILSGAWHMRIGMQSIIEDYVHGTGAKVALLIGNTVFSATVAITCVYGVLKIGLNS